MAVRVRIDDIVDALEMEGDEHLGFLNLDTGDVEVISRELLREAEEGAEDSVPDLPAWQFREWEISKQVVSSDRWRKLPTQFDVHEWAIMQEFSSTIRGIAGERLRDAIHGAGAFRSFKRAVLEHKLQKSWFAFRDQALRQIARHWCDENGIEHE